MGLGELRDMISMATGCIGIVSFFYAYFAKRSAATAIELKAAHERIDKLEDRLLKTEIDMRHLPDKEVTQRMEVGIIELRGELAALAASMKPMAATMTRLQDYVLDKSK